MEVVNHSPYYSTSLLVGRRYAQISFHRTAPIHRAYTSTGKYQTSEVLDELKKNWTPETMLPRMYEDREVGKKNPHQQLIRSLVEAGK